MKRLSVYAPLVAILTLALRAQNLVENPLGGAVLERKLIDPSLPEELVLTFPKPDFVVPEHGEAGRVAAKLDAHVAELVMGWPWRPFHHTIGISGYEACFDHPDELFYTLSLALPYLTEPTRAATGKLLARLVKTHPPYASEGFDRAEGQARERYDVPEHLRAKGRVTASSAFGVAAFWVYQNWAGYWCDPVPLDPHWGAILKRIEPLLKDDYSFDPARRDYARDEAEKLNGDLAGLIAFARLAADKKDAANRRRVLDRIAQLAQLRLDRERLDPRLAEKTTSASKSLHNFKIARFCDFTPDVAHVFDPATRALAASRLRAFREARNGWWIAEGDRFIGGENFTNPLHFSRALFTGAALVERLPGEELCRWIDIPACRADLCFIEKCALALGID